MATNNVTPYCCCCSLTSVVSNSVRPHRWQPTRLPCPWDSPGKNTGVGCRFLLQCMKVKSESEVAQLCPTLSDPMDCSLLIKHPLIFTDREGNGTQLQYFCLENPMDALLWQPGVAYPLHCKVRFNASPTFSEPTHSAEEVCRGQ